MQLHYNIMPKKSHPDFCEQSIHGSLQCEGHNRTERKQLLKAIRKSRARSGGAANQSKPLSAFVNKAH